MTPAIIILIGRTNWDGGHDDSLVLRADCDGKPQTMMATLSKVVKNFSRLYTAANRYGVERPDLINIDSLAGLLIGNSVSAWSTHIEPLNSKMYGDWDDVGYTYDWIYVIDFKIRDVSIYDHNSDDHSTKDEISKLHTPIKRLTLESWKRKLGAIGFTINQRSSFPAHIEQVCNTTKKESTMKATIKRKGSKKVEKLVIADVETIIAWKAPEPKKKAPAKKKVTKKAPAKKKVVKKKAAPKKKAAKKVTKK